MCGGSSAQIISWGCMELDNVSAAEAAAGIQNKAPKAWVTSSLWQSKNGMHLGLTEWGRGEPWCHRSTVTDSEGKETFPVETQLHARSAVRSPCIIMMTIYRHQHVQNLGKAHVTTVCRLQSWEDDHTTPECIHSCVACLIMKHFSTFLHTLRNVCDTRSAPASTSWLNSTSFKMYFYIWKKNKKQKNKTRI